MYDPDLYKDYLLKTRQEYYENKYKSQPTATESRGEATFRSKYNRYYKISKNQLTLDIK